MDGAFSRTEHLVTACFLLFSCSVYKFGIVSILSMMGLVTVVATVEGKSVPHISSALLFMFPIVLSPRMWRRARAALPSPPSGRFSVSTLCYSVTEVLLHLAEA